MKNFSHAENADIRRKNLPFILFFLRAITSHCRAGLTDCSDYSDETIIILIRKIKTKSMFKKLTQKTQIYAENNFRLFLFFLRAKTLHRRAGLF